MQHKTGQRSHEKKPDWVLRVLVLILLGLAIFHITPIHVLDPALEPYVQDYLNIVHTYCEDEQLYLPLKTSVKFVEKLDGEAVARCGRGLVFWDIQVLRSDWTSSSERERREIMYHELTHCILEKDHVDNPRNYMYYYISSATSEETVEQIKEDAWTRCVKPSLTN